MLYDSCMVAVRGKQTAQANSQTAMHVSMPMFSVKDHGNQCDVDYANVSADGQAATATGSESHLASDIASLGADAYDS